MTFPYVVVEAKHNLYIVVYILIYKWNYALDYVCPLPRLKHIANVNINMLEISFVT
jgi:hypothetical protein